MNKYLKPIGIYVLIFVVILAALAYTGPQILPQRNDAAQEEYVYSDLLKELDENNVASVEVSRRTEVGDYGTAEATLKDGSVIRVDVPSISVLQQVLDEKALTNDVKIDVGDLQRESMLSQVVPSLIMMIVMIIIFILLFMDSIGPLDILLPSIVINEFIISFFQFFSKLTTSLNSLIFISTSWVYSSSYFSEAFPNE